MNNTEITDSKMDTNELLENALWYARKGWHVLPMHSPAADGSCSCGHPDCGRIGKHPRIKDWLNRATTDEKTIVDWWTENPDANIGILTGEKSGIVVLDIDSQTGVDLLKLLMKVCEMTIPSVAALTGNGFHLYFAHPGTKVSNKQSLLPNIDIRGDGGCVVAPPSLHANGKRYRWEKSRHPMDHQLETMPDLLLDFIKIKGPGWIKEGTRNAYLFKFGAAFRGRGKEHQEVLKMLLWINEILCVPPLSESEVEKVAKSASKYEPNAESGENRETSIKSEDLIALATEVFQLFHSPDKVGYAVASINNRKVVMAVESRDFKEYLSKLCYDKFKRPAKPQPLQDTISVLKAQARYDFDEKEVHSRIAMEGNAIYIDLCNEEREVVQVTPSGWDIISSSPVHFLASKAAKPLPHPQKGGSINDLRKLINVKDDDQWIMVVSWLLKAFIPSGAFPILTIQGEQGSAKSTAAEIVKILVDPTKAPLRSLPQSKQDLYISAVHSWVLGYDNLSGMPPWVSDVLCCLSTGGGFSVRVLYSDNEETIFEAQRPIIINGIEDLATRNDLADRSLLIYLPAIPKEKRREKALILQEFEKAKPQIFGALLDAVSVALRNYQKVKLPTLPRMADFARWIVAAEPALPWEAGEFMKAYERNRKEALDVCFEGDILASVVRDFARAKNSWEGSATELLNELREFAPEDARDRNFPKAANRLSGRLRRIAPSLRNRGIDATEGPRTHGGKKRWIIQKK